MATLLQLKRNYYQSQLALSDAAVAKMSLTDLEWLFFSDPPAPGGGGGDPIMGGDISGVASNAQIVAGSVGNAEIDAAIKDPVAGTAGLRTLGTGAQQAAGGTDSRIVGAQQTSAKGAASGYAGLDAGTKVPVAQLGSGTASAATYLAGDQSYKDPAVGGDLTGTLSNAQIGAGTVGASETTSAIEKTANKNAVSGYAGLDSGALLSNAQLPANSLIQVVKSGGVWPARPTTRTDINCIFIGPDPSPSVVTSPSTGGMYNGDTRWITP